MSIITVDKSGFMVTAVTERGSFWCMTTSASRPVWSKDFPIEREEGTTEHVIYGAAYDDAEGKDFSSNEFYDIMWLYQVEKLEEGVYPLRHPLMIHSNMGEHQWAGLTDKGTLVTLKLNNRELRIKFHDVSDDGAYFMDNDQEEGVPIASEVVGILDNTQSLQWGMLASYRKETPKLAKVYSAERDLSVVMSMNPNPEMLDSWVASLDEKLGELV
ncbi:hypothetical protein HWC35_gp173 [Vibrio phage USC-1]|uniref:Uncharacterized protein n=2 Tax=Aphroditevirus USC1 TaxID=2846605 RepID=A0A514A2P8_9CAUD|nr:hypothetical protein HWC35_gp173 [Vibrio phage USC-1]QCW23161.1 hypothetical protein [Vibrio phage 5 TSL-2019]QDH47567.1 hypothetical protein [Vibrio phage USC-1]